MSSVPPRRCGVALYAYDLAAALKADLGTAIAISWVPVSDAANVATVGPVLTVLHGPDGTASSALAAAGEVNRHNPDVVWVQHEFGLFGRWGMPYRHSLDVFLGALRSPVVTTLHTVLSRPPESVCRAVQRIATLSAQLVVISRQAQRALHKIYDIPTRCVSVIPHGVRLVPGWPGRQRDASGDPSILSFGLIGPDKGLDNVIRALPAVVNRWSELMYTIAGQSHPSLSWGDSGLYRARLHHLVAELGVAPNVTFCDRFLSDPELDLLLKATDLVVVANVDAQQVSSGTLARAVGAGCAVLAAPNGHSRDLAATGAVHLLSAVTPDVIAAAIHDLLEQPERMEQLRARARLYASEHSWEVVARRSAHLLTAARIQTR